MIQARTAPDVDGAGEGLAYFTVGTFIQTFFFGLYTLLMFFSTRMLLKRRLNTTVNRAIFWLSIFMYTLTVFYWMYSIADVVDRIHALARYADNPSVPQTAHTRLTMWSPLFNSIMLINYFISDGVVVWRIWVICEHQYRRFLWITLTFLGLTGLTVLLLIGFRIAGTVIAPIDDLPTTKGIGPAINLLQLIGIITSLVSNFTGLAAVASTAFHHWKSLRAAFSHPKAADSARTNRILLLVVETGVLYCVLALISLFAALIHLPQGTLGDIYFPVSVQIAGAYPSIVLLLVSSKKSLSDSSFIDANDAGSGVFTTEIVSRPLHFVAPSQTDTMTENTLGSGCASMPRTSSGAESESVRNIHPFAASEEQVESPRPLSLPRPSRGDEMV